MRRAYAENHINTVARTNPEPMTPLPPSFLKVYSPPANDWTVSCKKGALTLTHEDVRSILQSWVRDSGHFRRLAAILHVGNIALLEYIDNPRSSIPKHVGMTVALLIDNNSASLPKGSRRKGAQR